MKIRKAKRRYRQLRRRALAQSIKLAWESLESHLKMSDQPAKKVEQDGNPEFHATCVRDYAFIIQALATELLEVAKQDYKRTCKPAKYKI